ncbi:uncharacterized protein LOC121601443 [Anopheles merus]|uniref:uncharacterized protein LOC121601443 n=1 Tax=Anopheles merus TaxID=30066 RepID=UPI001BE4C64D|nr:uncharacterized protein LOC121601443 [Anopheles merus]
MITLQINISNCSTSQNLILQAAKEQHADVILVSELYRQPPNNGNWAVDSSERVAVVAAGSRPIQRMWGSAVPGLVAADIGGITFISCYASPRMTVAEFEEFFNAVEIEVSAHPNVVLGGDFNAWHEAWGSARTKRKGEELLNIIEQLGLVVKTVVIPQLSPDEESQEKALWT